MNATAGEGRGGGYGPKSIRRPLSARAFSFRSVKLLAVWVPDCEAGGGFG